MVVRSHHTHFQVAREEDHHNGLLDSVLVFHSHLIPGAV